ncbi:MAG: PhoH family protein [Actinobacteria bacterium]|nr:PhoH family protein [Actinomycetota bacterium]
MIYLNELDNQIREVKILIPGNQPMVDLLGHRDEFLKIIESEFKSNILVRGNEIVIIGDEKEVEALSVLFEELINLLATGQSLNPQSIGEAIEIVRGKEKISASEALSDIILSYQGRSIRPKTLGQKKYVDSIRNNTITFAIGPAGTGKTYLAMAMAVQALKKKAAGRLILTRPAVEAGEKLGFLPGDLYAKVDPYLRPLYDALFDMMDPDQFHRFLERGVIEIAPLAYMRGRTLNDSFIILDEAQNTSPEQMKMFLTRFGFGSKIVITGDVTQVDLPEGRYSGLVLIEKILQGIKDIDFIRLDARDVVRHQLVQKIVEAYKNFDEKKKE